MPKSNAKNVVKHLTSLIEYLNREDASVEDRRVVADSFNEMIDALVEDDFFGTEAQLDPRGDQRNK